MPGIEFQDVAFAYPRSSLSAIHNMTFRLHQGVTGLIGPNGAGKSTLLRLIAGLLEPSRGTIRIDGMLPSQHRNAGRVGLIPEIPHFDGYLTVHSFVGGMRDLTGTRGDGFNDNLDGLMDKLLGDLSLGQKRRVELEVALMNNPSVILLDEPTNGLDPFAVAQLRETVDHLNVGARSIVISSHHLDELQRTANYFLLVSDGRCAGHFERDAAVSTYGSLENLFHAVIQPERPELGIC